MHCTAIKASLEYGNRDARDELVSLDEAEWHMLRNSLLMAVHAQHYVTADHDYTLHFHSPADLGPGTTRCSCRP